MKLFACAILAAILFAAPSHRLQGASIPGRLILDITNDTQNNDPQTYTLSFRVFGGNQTMTVTGPTGHVFPDTITNLPLSNALALVVGDWTITAFPDYPPNAPLETYSFTVSPIAESALFTIPPTIVTPANGSVVPPQFNWAIQWPAGIAPNGGKTSLSQNGSTIASFDSGIVATSLSYNASVTFKPGQTQGSLTLRGGTFNSLTSYVSPITSSVPTPYWSFTPDFRVSNYSMPISLIVSVPEPCAIGLASICILGLISVSRSRTLRIRRCM